MRLKIFTLMMTCLCIFSSCSASEKSKISTLCPSWLAPDSAIYNQLGKTLTNLLFSPKEVKCYAVEWQDTVTNDQLEPYFKRGKSLGKLTKEEIAVLQYSLLSNEANYVNDTIVVMSPYVPYLNFEFVGKKKQRANVLVSPSNFTWTILFDDKKQSNFNYHSKDFERFCNFYIKLADK